MFSWRTNSGNIVKTKPFNALIFVYWDEDQNVFYDQSDEYVNIFELITPHDLYLFRHDHGCCMFPCRLDNNLLCEIVIEE